MDFSVHCSTWNVRLGFAYFCIVVEFSTFQALFTFYWAVCEFIVVSSTLAACIFVILCAVIVPTNTFCEAWLSRFAVYGMHLVAVVRHNL